MNNSHSQDVKTAEKDYRSYNPFARSQDSRAEDLAKLEEEHNRSQYDSQRIEPSISYYEGTPEGFGGKIDANRQTRSNFNDSQDETRSKKSIKIL